MLLEEIAEKPTTGTFVGVKFANKTVDAIVAAIKDLKVPEPTPTDEIHSTLIYSRKPIPEFKAKGKLDEPIIAKPKSFEIFKSQTGKNCLVVKLNSPELVKRHKQIRKEHGATHDFDEYLPHVTLSYDCGDFDYSDKKVSDFFPEFEIVDEYDSPIDPDWNKKKSN